VTTHQHGLARRAFSDAHRHVRDAGSNAAVTGQSRRTRNAEPTRINVLENANRTTVSRIASKPGFDFCDTKRGMFPSLANCRRDIPSYHLRDSAGQAHWSAN